MLTEMDAAKLLINLNLYAGLPLHVTVYSQTLAICHIPRIWDRLNRSMYPIRQPQFYKIPLTAQQYFLSRFNMYFEHVIIVYDRL